jgi:hypothetical protein
MQPGGIQAGAAFAFLRISERRRPVLSAPKGEKIYVGRFEGWPGSPIYLKIQFH